MRTIFSNSGKYNLATNKDLKMFTFPGLVHKNIF